MLTVFRPYGNLDWKPMSPRTRKKVKWARIVQLLLRIGALLGAIGMLVCVIAIKNVSGNVAWILRIPPGIAIMHTVYAIYHLARSSKARTPASSASYMIFAAIIDTGLIPFFIFTALIARTEYTEPSNTQGRWKTLFGNDTADKKIVFSTFLFCVVNGGLHLVSLVISIYLTVIFRKISKLPPDMNPLEDNLTSRHKRNKSSISAPIEASEPNSKRGSQAEPLMQTRSVPFMQTRNDSSSRGFDIPTPNFSPRASRTTLPSPYDQPFKGNSSRASHSPSPRRDSFYDQSVSNRSSRTHVPPSPPKRDSFYDQTISNRSSRVQIPSSPPKRESFYDQPGFKRSSLQEFQSSPLKRDNFYSSANSSQTVLPQSAPINHPTPTPSSIYSTSQTPRPLSTRPQSTATSDTSSNWVTHPSPPPSPPAEFKHLINGPYKAVPQPAQASAFRADSENFNPLELNPPTPPNTQRTTWSPVRKGLMPGSGNIMGTGSALGFGSGKLRGYEGMGKKTRVVSSGVDMGNAGVKQRGVSGKLVEEGRGGGGYYDDN